MLLLKYGLITDKYKEMLLSPDIENYNLAVALLEEEGNSDMKIIDYLKQLFDQHKRYTINIKEGNIDRVENLPKRLWEQLQQSNYRSQYTIYTGKSEMEALTLAIENYYNKK